MRYLATIPSMKEAFEDLVFPEVMDLDSKVRLIVGLIKGLSEIDEFHELVSIKSERIQALTKEKTELIAQLKVD
jgi:flagellar biosynthesis/type III secretory pathway chaperone